MTYGQLCCKIRGKLYISQQKLADEIGVSYTSVNRWERGRSQPDFISKHKLADYAQKVGIDISDLEKN